MCWWPASCHLGLILSMALSHGSVSWEADSALATDGTCVAETHPVTMSTSHDSGPRRVVRQDPAPLLWPWRHLPVSSYLAQAHPEILQQGLAAW